MTQTKAFDWTDRLKASGIHLGMSLAIAALAALLVFALWYPYPYREISGGRELFFIVVAVDVVLGPLITLAVFNRSKPRSELVRDLGIVGLIQLAALIYGLWTVSVARPVHLVFELDRFRVVHAIDVPEKMLLQAPPSVGTMPLTGPTLLAVRPFRDAGEETNATLVALQGLHLSARPDLWEDYEQARPRVLAAAKPAAELKRRFPAQVSQIDAAIARTGRPEGGLRYLPVAARKSLWTALIDANSAEVCGFVPLDSF
ncbi:MAG: TfpX/TfpZ family type IV pilin accessory protein [Hylemonella sp.]|uniref:TfpX/TfpZ family type IV pilin accessory protein n=1 Tax=Hylemonella sp. TaxID=2066020 RepID=UPI0022C70366|nr:TfpX/TfpZ family type IV pilin accessory protein [Hylemonella sp.]MCZ8252913.1 TfpX/TfpZ family type IV pilin accessory protein [Hylemonella sp.]